MAYCLVQLQVLKEEVRKYKKRLGDCEGQLSTQEQRCLSLQEQLKIARSSLQVITRQFRQAA